MQKKGDGASRERRRLAPAERKDHLLDVAAALVVEQGVDAVTMERVAQHAGVSRGLGYAYFENSDDLLTTLYQREVAAFDGRVAAASANAVTIEEHLRGAVGTYFEILAEKGVLLARLIDAGSQSALQQPGSARDRVIEKFYGELLTRELGLPPKRARAVASILMRALPFAAELWARGILRRAEAIELFVTMSQGAATAVAEHPFEPRASASAERS